MIGWSACQKARTIL